MAIDATQRKHMKPGLKLTATYKKAEHTAEVIASEDGKVLYRLGDGREFKSPSAAGSAVMGGVACNGWRFWSVENADEPAKSAKKVGTAKGGKSKAAVKKPGDAKAQLAEVLGMDEESPTD